MKKRLICIFLLITVIFSMFSTKKVGYAQKGMDNQNDFNDKIIIDFHIDNQWNTAYNATITIYNNSLEEIKDWLITFELNNDIYDIWCANIKYKQENNYTIEHLD